MRWESRMTFSRESFTVPLRRSQDDALLPRQLLLHHLEHLRVGDVRTLHLGSMLDEDLADLLVELVLDMSSSVITRPMLSTTRAWESISSLPSAERVFTILREMYSISSEVSRIEGVSITYCGQGPGMGA